MMRQLPSNRWVGITGKKFGDGHRDRIAGNSLTVPHVGRAMLRNCRICPGQTAWQRRRRWLQRLRL